MSSKTKVSLYYLLNFLAFTYFYYLIYIDKINLLFISLFVFVGLLIAIQSYNKEIYVKEEKGLKKYILGLIAMFFFFMFYNGGRNLIYLIISYIVFIVSHFIDYYNYIKLIEE